METHKKWFQNNLVIISLLILFFPAGLFMMWKHAGWKRVFKWVVTIVLALFIIISASSGSSSPPTQSQNQVPQPTQKVINYKIFQRWEIPNGGEGKVVIINPENFNEADMILLGEKLKNDTSRDRNAFIFVFTDRKAAEMRDKVLTDELSEEDRDFYDKHYVAEYAKNGNSGFHEFVIYFDGVMGTNSKTINY